MTEITVRTLPFKEFGLWQAEAPGALFSVIFEVTARCNFNCRHCYINRAAGDVGARAAELSTDKLLALADEAVSMGALWALITGGEPLLRPDFEDLYMGLKRRGLLVSVFTNAGVVADRHVRLFKKYPPRNLEVSVYGVSPETCEAVTRVSGAYQAFERGVFKLLEAGVAVSLKAVITRSNYDEFPAIADFCRRHSHAPFRFDPLLHLRIDGNRQRNREIRQERLSVDQVVAVEQADPERTVALAQQCALVGTDEPRSPAAGLFRCAVGRHECVVGYDGYFRVCSSMTRPDLMVDLRGESLSGAWQRLAPGARALEAKTPAFRDTCMTCRLGDLCLNCPANAYLEEEDIEARVDYFCRVAHARAGKSFSYL